MEVFPVRNLWQHNYGIQILWPGDIKIWKITSLGSYPFDCGTYLGINSNIKATLKFWWFSQGNSFGSVLGGMSGSYLAVKRWDGPITVCKHCSQRQLWDFPIHRVDPENSLIQTDTDLYTKSYPPPSQKPESLWCLCPWLLLCEGTFDKGTNIPSTSEQIWTFEPFNPFNVNLNCRRVTEHVDISDEIRVCSLMTTNVMIRQMQSIWCRNEVMDNLSLII